MDNKSWRCVIHREINITPSYLVSNKSDESSVMSGGCGGENINMTLLSHNSSVYFVKIVQKDLCVVWQDDGDMEQTILFSHYLK